MDIAVGHIPHIIIPGEISDVGERIYLGHEIVTFRVQVALPTENTYISWKDKMKPRITMEDGIIPEEYQAML